MLSCVMSCDVRLSVSTANLSSALYGHMDTFMDIMSPHYMLKATCSLAVPLD